MLILDEASPSQEAATTRMAPGLEKRIVLRSFIRRNARSLTRVSGVRKMEEGALSISTGDGSPTAAIFLGLCNHLNR